VGRRSAGRATTERERSAQLSEEEILDAALRLTRRVGLDQLTMRQLADELGVTPMAAYYYVPNKEALLQLVADSVLAEVDVPAGLPWDDHLRALADRLVKAVSTYPGLGAYLVANPMVPGAYRLTEGVLRALVEGGFDDREAILAHATVYTYLLGRLGLEARLRGRPRHLSAVRRKDKDLPLLQRVGEQTAKLRASDYLHAGLETIIAGLHASRSDRDRDDRGGSNGRKE